jgi:hypothetical protein
LICRIGPDDLARSFFSGPATFVLDIAPGRYEVWLLTGDSGLLEYVPHEPYKIIVEGATAYDFNLSADEFYNLYETPPSVDELSHADIWRNWVGPRFKWVKTLVHVEDGQLNIHLEGGHRDFGILDFLGDYAFTELRGGPQSPYAGSLNALVVRRAGSASGGEAAIAKIDAWRRENLAVKWPLHRSTGPRPAKISSDDRTRGYTVFFPKSIDPVTPSDRRPHEEKAVRLRATPGEYLPITVGICPLTSLGITKIGFDAAELTCDSGGFILPLGGNFTAGVVRYAARPDGSGKTSWRPAPAMIVPIDTWRIDEGVTRQFWLTCRIPEQTQPGVYKGRIVVAPENAPHYAFDVEIEVLPFKLQRPAHIAVGITYFSPVQYAYFDEERFWPRMEAEFLDMRAHNLTCVQYTGIRMDDYRRIGRAFNLYRKVGFEHPVNLLESYGTMRRLQREGVGWGTEEFHAQYVHFISEFLEEARRHAWPPVIINFGDEFTNQSLEEFGARVGRNLKTIPGIVTGADVNGYKELTLMAPVVDIVAFNNGWDGPDRVNRGKRLLNKETVELVKKAGAIPWLVNVGIDRFSNGYWLWKMVRLGVRGKMEWIYRSYNGLPFDSFDASPLGHDIVYPGPNGTTVPSLDYEWMRMGLDDLAYLYTLEKKVEVFRDREEKTGAVTEADDFLRRLSDSLEDDMNKYTDRTSGASGESIVWPADKFDTIRNQVVDLILKFE